MQQEAKDHVALGELLKRGRSASARRAVESVLAQPISVRQKIDRIEQIDAEESARARSPAVSSEAPVAQPTPEPADEGRSARRHARPSHRRPVKVILSTESYLYFVLRQFRRIAESGTASGMVEGFYLPPRVRLSREVERAFRESVAPLAGQVLALCEQALKNGWLYVPKLQYNLIALCADLCGEVLSDRLHSLDVRDHEFLSRIRLLENAYLTFSCRPDYIGLLVKGLTEVFQREGYGSERVEQIPVLVHRLLSDVCRSSLQSIILAANMVKYRRYLTLQDLVRKDAAEPVDAQDFDASDEVKEAISRYLGGAEDRLASLGRKGAEIARVRSFLPPTFATDEGRPVLGTFYALGEADRKNALADERNAVVMVSRLVRNYLTVFGGLLCGRAVIDGLGTVQVFESELFGTHVLRLKGQLEKAVKVSYALPSLPRERLRVARLKSAALPQGEGEFLQIVSEVADVLYDISERLSRLLIEGAASAPGALLRTEEDRAEIGFRARMLGDPLHLRGRTVEDALSYAVCVGYLSLFHLEDRRIGDVVRNEAKVRGEVTEVLASIERIADPVVYAGMQSKYSS